jgi:hypothetical protein
MVEMVALQEIFHCFGKSWAIVSKNLTAQYTYMLRTAAYAWYRCRLWQRWGRSGNDWKNEDLTSLVQLADVTSFSIPVNIADHAGPPEVLADVCFGSIEGLVTE